MITQFRMQVTCECGQAHAVPIDIKGRVAFICPNKTTLRHDPTMHQYQMSTSRLDDLIRRCDAENLMEIDKVPVHKAGEPEGHQQKCTECGELLLDYWDYRTLFPARPVGWYSTGALIGKTKEGVTFLTVAPLSPFREELCHAMKRVM